MRDHPLTLRDLMFIAGAALTIIGVIGLGWQAACVVAGAALVAAAKFGWRIEWHSSTDSDSSPPPDSPPSG